MSLRAQVGRGRSARTTSRCRASTTWPSPADVSPGLTTVRLPMGEMGERALALALKEPGSRPRKQRMPSELVVRDSTGPVRDAGGYFLVFSPGADVDNAAMKASCGTSTRPTIFIRFLPSFCFSSSLRFRVMSPP